MQAQRVLTNKRKKSKWFIVVIAILLVYYVYLLYGQQNIINTKKQQLSSIQTKIESEKVTGEDLQKQKDMLFTDDYIGKIAREKLGMVKPGEKIYVDVNK